MACNKTIVQKPLLINKDDVMKLPTMQWKFESKEKKWKAYLYTFTQPIELEVTTTFGGFIVQYPGKKGCIEGNAILCLHNGKTNFFYDVKIENSTSEKSLQKDYRSPKTLNVDSSLVQQQIVHVIDENRNLKALNNNNLYFFEENKTLPTIAKTYRAISNESLTAYYVKPGSAKAIVINYEYNSNKKEFEIITNQIKDEHGNIIADGTKVNFIITDKKSNSIASAATLNGVALIQLPQAFASEASVIAQINKSQSSPIYLNQ